MNETADIKALREAAMKATAGEWCTDSQHSVIADAGLNENYYVAACSGPDSKINAKFIRLANPATIIALLDQLEAERQRADAYDAEWRAQEERAENAEAELAALRGEQEPVAWIVHARAGDQLTTDGGYVANAESMGGIHSTSLYRQPKPVVIAPDRAGMFYTAANAGFVSRCDNEWKAALEAAGIVVKDGK